MVHISWILLSQQQNVKLTISNSKCTGTDTEKKPQKTQTKKNQTKTNKNKPQNKTPCSENSDILEI